MEQKVKDRKDTAVDIAADNYIRSHSSASRDACFRAGAAYALDCHKVPEMVAMLKEVGSLYYDGGIEKPLFDKIIALLNSISI